MRRGEGVIGERIMLVYQELWNGVDVSGSLIYREGLGEMPDREIAR